jgi:hypothetical protein
MSAIVGGAIGVAAIRKASQRDSRSIAYESGPTGIAMACTAAMGLVHDHFGFSGAAVDDLYIRFTKLSRSRMRARIVDSVTRKLHNAAGFNFGSGVHGWNLMVSRWHASAEFHERYVALIHPAALVGTPFGIYGNRRAIAVLRAR